MNLLGLITLMDPARPEVPQAVQDCLAAGVKVVMVTGDHPITAKAIAKNIGVITFSTKEDLAQERGLDISQIDENEVRSIVIHGAMIPSMTEADWTNALNKDQIVFARTSPEQKLIIVQKFTSVGNIVAMTGDGVNDSPALKQAAIGVAMGKNGSDVAREAADLVLLDDNFASIVIAIKEGRLLFANLKKSIAYTLAHLSPEIVPIFLWAFIGFPLAINGVLILCIDLLTEVPPLLFLLDHLFQLLPAMSLIYESPESDLINVPPRNPRVDLLVTPNLLLYSYFQIGFIHTGVCYFVSYLVCPSSLPSLLRVSPDQHAQVFSSYGLTFENLAKTNNQYFTANPIGPYSATDGKEFSPSEQKNILDVTQGSWFLMIVIGQAVHIWTCRTLTSSLFHHGFFTNIWTIFGVFIALCIGIFLVYCPGVQDVVMARNPPSLVILYGALLSIALIIPFTEGRKYLLCLLSPKCDSLLKF
jgi:sodium/potassium-transporting ATPase subunit alpha